MKSFRLICLCIGLLVILSDCKKNHHDEPVYYTSSFTVNNSVKSFKTTSSFNRLCILTGVCNAFYLNTDNILTNYLNLGFPLTVKTGDTYTRGGDGVQILYTDDQGRQFFSSAYDSLYIHIDLWEGHAGWAKGTFSGKLRHQSLQSNDSIFITNGTFSSKIWYVFQ